MRKFVGLLLLTLSLFSLNQVRADSTVTLRAKFDSIAMFMGDQCNLTYTIIQPVSAKVIPLIDLDSLSNKLEVIERSLDTVQLDHNDLQIRRNFRVTSFDTTIVYVPGQAFVIDGDTAFSNAVSLRMVAVPLDTANAIADFRGVYEVKTDWWRLIRMILYALIGGLIVAFVVYKIVVYYKKKHHPKEEEEVYVDPRSASELALESLKMIEAEAPWKAGKNKLYYSELSDTLKKYIARRFSVQTAEHTSSEVLDMIKSVPSIHDNQSLFKDLAELFSRSDMVKFAKFVPSEEAHLQSLAEARVFIESTALKEDVDDVDDVGDEDASEKNNPKGDPLTDANLKGEASNLSPKTDLNAKSDLASKDQSTYAAPVGPDNNSSNFDSPYAPK